MEGQLYAFFYAILHENWAPIYFAICRGSWNQFLLGTEGYWSFGGVKSYAWTFDCMRTSALNSSSSSGQIYIYFYCMWYIFCMIYIFLLNHIISFFNFNCYSITVVCLFSPSLHTTPAETTSLPHLHPSPWFCPCVLYSSSYKPLSSLSPPHSPLVIVRLFLTSVSLVIFCLPFFNWNIIKPHYFKPTKFLIFWNFPCKETCSLSVFFN